MKNKVELLGYYGGDKRSCLSAWQSTTDELGIELPVKIEDRVDEIFKHLCTKKKKSPDELLKFLETHGHETPFEKSILDFQITAEIASHVHALKHRISSINAESSRYKELTNRYYIPFDWNISLKEYPDLKWNGVLEEHIKLSFKLYHQSLEELTPKLGRKRAKESSRYFLTYATQLNFDWQMNFRSFVNIMRLRNNSHAQKEIHFIANTMLYLVENIEGNPFKYCLEAFSFKSDPNYLLINNEFKN